MDQFRNSSAGRPRSLSPGGATGGAASDPAATAIGTIAPVGVPHPHKQRPDIKPWIRRDPIPQSVKEEVIRKAKAERVAFVQHVVAAPFRMLWRLTRSPQRASDGGNASPLVSEQDRIVRAAKIDRERARGQLLATVFALPNAILGRRRAASGERAAAVDGAGIASPVSDRSAETR